LSESGLDAHNTNKCQYTPKPQLAAHSNSPLPHGQSREIAFDFQLIAGTYTAGKTRFTSAAYYQGGANKQPPAILDAGLQSVKEKPVSIS
jgi:hypothetical protein